MRRWRRSSSTGTWLSTRRVYELTLAALAKDFGSNVEVVGIGRDDLRAFCMLATTWLRRRRGTGWWPPSGTFFACCSRQGWVAASPAVGLERRRERSDRVQVGRTRAIPLEELEAFLRTPRHALRERLLWRMLYETAARAQEILLLDVADLDVPNKRAMVIGKAETPSPSGGRRPPPGYFLAT